MLLSLIESFYNVYIDRTITIYLINVHHGYLSIKTIFKMSEASFSMLLELPLPSQTTPVFTPPHPG